MPNPSTPIEFSELKRQLRDGLDSQESRAFWWPVLPSITTATKVIDSVPDTIGIAERLKEILKEPLLDHSAPANKGDNVAEQTVRKVSYVLINQNKLNEVEVSYFISLLRLIVWQVNRVDVCYYLATEIIANPDRYYRPGPSSAFAMFHSFREILKRFMPHTFSALRTIGALDDKYLSMMFVDYFVELIPSHILLPLLDAYLLEGVKVLFRYALSLIVGYKAAIKSGEFSTAKEFWLAIKSDSFAVTSFNGGSVIMKALAFDEVLPTVDQFVVFEHAKNQDYLNSNELKLTAFDSERSMFQKASKPMNVSRSNLLSLKRQASVIEPPEIRNLFAHRQSVILNRNSSITGKMMEGGSSAQASLSRKQSIRTTPQRTSTTAATSTPNSPIPRTAAPVEDNMLIHPATLIASHSSILDVGRAEKLLSCLPRPYDESQYELRFATYQSGWDLSSLYARIERYENCIFLFHLQPPFEDMVIGAFNRGPLSPPNQSVIRGDGRSSRIFRLEEGAVAYYPWIFYDKSEEEIEEMSESLPTSTVNQFAVSTTTSLSFGAGSSTASNAIRLDADLRNLYLGPSDTYDNPPLLVDSEQSLISSSSTHFFPLKDIEIFCASANRHVLKD